MFILNIRFKYIVLFLLFSFHQTSFSQKCPFQFWNQKATSELEQRSSRVIQFLKDWGLSEEDITRVSENNSDALTRVDPDSLKEVLDFLKKGVQPEDIQKLIKENFSTLVQMQSNVENLKEVIQFLLISLNFTKKDVRHLIMNNLKGLVTAKANDLREKTKRTFLDKAYIRSVLMNHLRDFSKVNPKELGQLIEYLHKDFNFTKKDARDLFRKNLTNLPLIKTDHIQSVVSVLEEHNINEDDIYMSLKNDIYIYTKVDPEELDYILGRMESQGFPAESISYLVRNDITLLSKKEYASLFDKIKLRIRRFF